MSRNIFRAGLFAIAFATGLSTQHAAASDEQDAWLFVKENGTSSEVYDFIEKYPNGAFTKEAKAYMIDLLWLELAAAGPEKKSAVRSVAVPVAAPAVKSLTFTTPLSVGEPGIIGRSFAELINGSPAFPPVEGLPEEYWKSKECSSCHEWKQANLCTQANTYLSDLGSENLTKKHPYGGSFKRNLVTWASDGCK